MQITAAATRRVLVLVLTALITAATAFAGAASAITASVSDEQAGSRVASDSTSREST